MAEDTKTAKGQGKGSKVTLGKGLDIGTANLVAAEVDESGVVQTRPMRNAFIDVPVDNYTKNMLTRLKVPYVSQGKKMYVLGHAAFELANVLNRNTRRPMSDGLISPKEVDALPVMVLLIKEILREPRVPNELCYYSVPAAPIDSDLNVTYHKEVFDSVLRKVGYEPRSMVEGHCVVFSTLAEQDFTGIGISCGGGMFNICVSYKGLPALSFSTSRAGDWIDNNASKALGIKASKLAQIKEGGVDLMKPKDRNEEAISIYYRNLVNYTLTNIAQRFVAAQDVPSFPDPIWIVCAGGTSMAINFIELFKDEFSKVEFPLKIAGIRMAEDPFHAVAKGCLTAAISEAGE